MTSTLRSAAAGVVGSARLALILVFPAGAAVAATFRPATPRAAEGGPGGGLAPAAAVEAGDSIVGLTLFSVPAGSDPYPSRFVAGDSGRAVPYRVDVAELPAGVTREAGLAAVARAFAAWGEATGLHFHLEEVGPFGRAADGVAPGDGRIRIQFHDGFERITDPRILAFGGLFTESGPVGLGYGGRVGDQEFHRTTGGYVILNHRDPLLSDPRTLEEVLAHEIGHVLGLAHSSEDVGESDPDRRESLVFFQLHGDGRGAALTDRDRRVAAAAYPAFDGPPPAMADVIDAVTVAGGTELLVPDLLRTPAGADASTGWTVRLHRSGTTSAWGEFSIDGGSVVYHPFGFFDRPAGEGAAAFHDRAVYRVQSAEHASAFEVITVRALARDGWGSTPDGLPDTWVEAWFGPGAVVDPDGDHDGDGCSEAAEFRQGTDPTDAASRLLIGLAGPPERRELESSGVVVLELACTAPPARPAVVRWNWTGTAGFGVDYDVPTAFAGGALVPPGADRLFIPVRLLDDDVSEGLESVRLEITSVEGAGLGGPSAVTVTIEDDEAPPVYAFASATHTLAEGAAEPVGVRVLRSGRIDAPSCVLVRARASGEATSIVPSADLGAADWELCFAPGATEATLPLSALDDAEREPPEQGFLELEPIGGGLLVPGGDVSMLEILDNDGEPEVTISAAPAREGEPHAEVRFALSHGSALPVAVNLEFRDGSARSGEDFVGPTGGVRVEIPPGASDAVLRIPLLDDDWSEGAEAFGLVVTSVENAVPSTRDVRLVIEDDEPLPALVAPTRVDGLEGEVVALGLRISPPATFPVEFAWRWVPGATALPPDPGDGSGPLEGIIRFEAGETTGTLAFMLPDDAFDEPDETGRLEWRGSGSGAADPLPTEVLVRDDDPRPRLMLEDLEVSEGAGEAGFRVRLDQRSGWEVSLQLQAHDGTAVAGVDYRPAGSTLVLPPGATEATWPIALIDDFSTTGAREFEVRVGLVRNVTLDRTRAVVRIVEDDPADAVTVRTGEAGEGDGAVTVELLRSTTSPEPTRLRIRTLPGSAVASVDYLPIDEDVEIPPGGRSVAVEIPVLDDFLDEDDETFEVVLIASGPSGPTVVGAPFVVTLGDDDGPPTLEASDVVVGEDRGRVDIPLRLSSPSGRVVSGIVRSAGGDAAPGLDFAPAEAAFSFAPGETGAVVTVEIIDDALAEATETARFSFAEAPTAEHADTAFSIAIRDDEGVPSQGRLETGFDTATGRPVLQWRGLEGGVYDLEFSGNLRDWAPAFDAPLAASGLWETLAWPPFEDGPEDPSAASRRFFRLKSVVPPAAARAASNAPSMEHEE